MDHGYPTKSQFDSPFNIGAAVDRFSITLGKERRLDGELGISIAQFEVEGNQVSRVPPLALTPEDFLDEWSKLTWDEVAPWSTDSVGNNLRDWHTKLNGLQPGSAEIEFVQPCPKIGSEDDSWLIGLWIDRQENRMVGDERLYISINQKLGAYQVVRIEKLRPEGCPGNARPLLLREMELPSSF
jgi:hypothetical protein